MTMAKAPSMGGMHPAASPFPCLLALFFPILPCLLPCLPADPRFEATAGKFSEDAFEQNFSFLQDYRKKELAELKAALKKEKSGEKKDQLQGVYNKLHQTAVEQERRQVVKQAVRSHAKEEAAKVASGKMPFFLKKKARKELEATAQYKALESKGGESAVEKALRRRRKKLAGKEKKRLPAALKTRRGALEEESAGFGGGGGGARGGAGGPPPSRRAMNFGS